MRQPAAPRAKKRHVKSTGWHSVWEEGQAPSDDVGVVRSGAAAIQDIWENYMIESGECWRDHTTHVNEAGDLDQRVQPAADLQRIGNVVRFNSTQHNCYLVRSMINLGQVDARLREHFWVLKNTLTKDSRITNSERWMITSSNLVSPDMDTAKTTRIQRNRRCTCGFRTVPILKNWIYREPYACSSMLPGSIAATKTRG